MTYLFQPLRRGTTPPVSDEQVRSLSKMHSVSTEQARALLEQVSSEEVWLNDTYQVNVRQAGAWVHLSIKRIDKEPVTDWRDKQEIKNQLVGPECEGVELYPAESRLVDGSNQYHLWVMSDPSNRIPVGWEEGRRVSSTPLQGGKQRR